MLAKILALLVKLAAQDAGRDADTARAEPVNPVLPSCSVLQSCDSGRRRAITEMVVPIALMTSTSGAYAAR